jgi:hypothetical protein
MNKYAVCLHLLCSGFFFPNAAYAIQPHVDGIRIMNEKLAGIEKRLDGFDLESDKAHVASDRIVALQEERAKLEGERERLLSQLELSNRISQTELVMYAVPSEASPDTPA